LLSFSSPSTAGTGVAAGSVVGVSICNEKGWMEIRDQMRPR
jgi:hypothetical protein